MVHISGNYMFIETSAPRKPGDKARLSTGPLNANKAVCLQFYYHMSGANIGSLNIWVQVCKIIKP